MIWMLGHQQDYRLQGPDGTTWFFLAGHDHEEGMSVQRIFFWDQEKSTTGMAEFRGNDTLHFSRLKNLMRRIAKDAQYRSRFRRPLEFPIERYW